MRRVDLARVIKQHGNHTSLYSCPKEHLNGGFACLRGLQEAGVDLLEYTTELEHLAGRTLSEIKEWEAEADYLPAEAPLSLSS